MGVLVKDILKLDIFKKSSLIAGQNGLNNSINRVSVFDCPIQEDRDRLVLKEGDLFITNFFAFKKSTEYSIYAINFLKSCNCSGLCITNEYIDFFSDALINHCNKINFPVISIDYTISYGDIIRDISYLIYKNEEEQMHELLLKNLINTNSLLDTKKILNTLNPHLLDYITVIYFYGNNINNNLLSTLNIKRENICISFKDGFIFLLSYSNKNMTNIHSLVNYFIEVIKSNVDDYVIGVSSNYKELTNAKYAVQEAITSATSINLYNEKIVYYSNLGVIPLLYNIKDTPETKNFYYNTINPILEYDLKYKKDLLHTLVTFIDCGSDYKLCSNILYQHENTIRYRILKIKSILDLNNNLVEFYERISLAVKLHKIYNNHV